MTNVRIHECTPDNAIVTIEFDDREKVTINLRRCHGPSVGHKRQRRWDLMVRWSWLPPRKRTWEFVQHIGWGVLNTTTHIAESDAMRDA